MTSVRLGFDEEGRVWCRERGREQERIAWLFFRVLLHMRRACLARERGGSSISSQFPGPRGCSLSGLFSTCLSWLCFVVSHTRVNARLVWSASPTRRSPPPTLLHLAYPLASSCCSHSSSLSPRFLLPRPPSQAASTPSHTLRTLTLRLQLRLDLPRTRPRPHRRLPRTLADWDGDVSRPEEGAGVLSQGASPLEGLCAFGRCEGRLMRPSRRAAFRYGASERPRYALSLPSLLSHPDPSLSPTSRNPRCLVNAHTPTRYTALAPSSERSDGC